jgi:voltage-gated potassium channel
VLHVNGSALEDEILEEAGIGTARAIVVATDSDADNVYITLSAREKNPCIAIHARGESETGLRRLKSAGANQVISAYQRGGMRIASMILRPAVVDFLELATPGHGDEIDLEEIEIEPGSHAVGKTIEAVERATSKLRVVALKRGDDPISIIPDSSTVVKKGDHLVAIGDIESLRRLGEDLEKPTA